MKNHTEISIVMPNYNSYHFLKESIKSIFSQTFTNWELIIVDDNSNSETKKFLRSFKKVNNKIKIYFLKKNKGDGFCRIYGVSKAKSKIIAFIDSDDIWKKDKLEKQLKFMKKNKFDFTYTYYTPFKKNRILNSVNPPSKFDFDSFIKNTSIATSSIMVKKTSLKNIKLSHSPNFEDYYLKCQILKKTKFAYCLKKSLMKYRIKKHSLSKNKLRNIYWLWKINRQFNKLNFLSSIISLILVSYNSLKKYGLK